MDEIEIPQYFICPISLQLMKDPVTTLTGITYERQSIEQWLATSSVCPVTKQTLSSRPSDLTPNHMLRRLIQAWCIANAKNGIDRIPMPKSPVRRSLVLKLIRDVNSNDSNLLNALKKLDELAAESEKNRSCMAMAGVTKSMVYFLIRCFKDIRINGLDEALRILQLTWIATEENKKIVEENYVELVESILWILNNKVIENTAKTQALVVLKNVFDVASDYFMERLDSRFFKEMVCVLRSYISVQATRAALSILIKSCPLGRNKTKIIDGGAVHELIEMELISGGMDRKTTEMVFNVLAKLCSVADGRQQLLTHAGGIAVVAKRLLRVSPATDDRALCVMDKVARFAGTREVVMEMLRVGGVTKLCMVLQADCEGYLKKKAREILRLHSEVWSNSPCIQVYLMTRYAR